MTTTVIDQLPLGWLDSEKFGTGWGDDDPAEYWAMLFDLWLARRFPGGHLTRVGNEVIGPATYAFPDGNFDRDTPPAESLPELPESLYESFREEYADNWVEEIEKLLHDEG